jgi:phage/plasmid-like protein (TIGR03299 family)
MAHNLENDRSMFWTEGNPAPWHGLGVKLPARPSWEQISATVGFYKALEREVYVAGNPEPVEGMKALVRSDNGATLSVVSSTYGIVDFDQMAEAVVTAAGGEATFHTGGLLGKNGARGWIMGELGEPLVIPGYQSEIRRYFLVTGSHDGSPVKILNCETSVVCQNTLGTALGERGNWHQTIRHTRNAADRVQAAAVAFRQLSTGYERFGQLANVMVKTRLTDAQMGQVVEAMVPAAPDTGKVSAQAQEKREKLQGLFETAVGVDAGIRGTAWAAFMALTEYADHHLKIRALPAQAQAARVESIWFGSGAEFKRDSLQVLAQVGGFKVA